jgi:G3E family GTPase
VVKLIIVTGFLGSGKTTLILPIALELTNHRKEKVAIVENEVGQIGIDGNYLELEGLTVQELSSGCICCSMTNDLLDTLIKLRNAFHPDVILIEPSGVADPERILKTIDSPLIGFTEKQVILVVDVARFKTIMAAMFPFVQKGFDVADIVAINKIDEVGQVALTTLIGEIRGLTPCKKIFQISASMGIGLSELMNEIC